MPEYTIDPFESAKLEPILQKRLRPGSDINDHFLRRTSDGRWPVTKKTNQVKPPQTQQPTTKPTPQIKPPPQIHKHKPTFTDASNEPSTVSNVFKPPEKQVGKDGPISSVSGQEGGSREIKVGSANKRPRFEPDDSDSGINTANEDSNQPFSNQIRPPNSFTTTTTRSAPQMDQEDEAPQVDAPMEIQTARAGGMNQALGHRGTFAGVTQRNYDYDPPQIGAVTVVGSSTQAIGLIKLNVPEGGAAQSLSLTYPY
ncbi:hypothetical protein BpHYR1_022662 [Brachionus plicatilis]|uniref:Uncharacterized protein n=1 Tax=Brachionus plicatilis TaxID=10195 RepID=A0A3M7SJ65_BRAPC|nr:hypothetical protein BpHYR1_022662 [Brachionus plicatilis]